MKINLSLLACVFLISACDYFGDPGSAVILNIDNEFEVGIREVLFEDHRELEFNITSVEKLDCKDAALELSQNLSGNAININVTDISMPTPCVEEESFPSGLASFELPENNYIVGVRVQDQVPQAGELHVTPDGYHLDLNNAKGFIAEKEVLNRIPNAFVWGYYKATNNYERDLLDSFLIENGYETKPLTHLLPGNYSYFSITAQGAIIIDDLPKDGIVKALAFDLTVLDDIKEVVSNFKSTHKDLQLILHGSDGSLL
jgi:hypothetical protein